MLVLTRSVRPYVVEVMQLAGGLVLRLAQFAAFSLPIDIPRIEYPLVSYFGRRLVVEASHPVCLLDLALLFSLHLARFAHILPLQDRSPATAAFQLMSQYFVTPDLGTWRRNFNDAFTLFSKLRYALFCGVLPLTFCCLLTCHIAYPSYLDGRRASAFNLGFCLVLLPPGSVLPSITSFFRFINTEHVCFDSICMHMIWSHAFTSQHPAWEC